MIKGVKDKKIIAEINTSNISVTQSIAKVRSYIKVEHGYFQR
jgi:hypothetical protein